MQGWRHRSPGAPFLQTVIATLFNHHDLRLVALAALVCALSAFAGMSLLNHARRTEGVMRAAWLIVAAVSVGFGIWSTHFVAMLSFQAGMPTGYDIPLTLVSLGIAVSIVGGGLWYVTLARRTSDALLGGAVVGLGISTMHYVGMAALMLGGEIAWAPELVVAVMSILILLFALGGIYLDMRERARAQRETVRMRGLADAAVEGLLVCDGDVIVTANASFLQMVE